MFITSAYAQGAAATPGATDMLVSIVPFLFIMGIMWFLILRPQRQAQKKHQETLQSLRRGDSVILTGGLIGKVSKVVSDTELEVEIADNTRVRVVRSMVADVRAKGETVASAKD